MLLSICIGRNASCLNCCQDTADEETAEFHRILQISASLRHLLVFCILLPFHVFQWPSGLHFTSYWIKPQIHSPSFKRVVSWDDVSAVLADEELDSIIEWMQALLGHGGLCLLDDIQGVRGAQAQCIDVAQRLQAAVWVHAIHQAICRKVRKILEQW